MEYQLYHTLEAVKKTGKDINTIKQDVYSLWKLCFGDTDEYTDFYFNWKVIDNQIYTMYNDKIISSMLHLNPYELMVHGNRVLTNYIVGVATREEDRRKGLMKSLLEEGMKQMYHENIPFTYLMPAKESIYLPFGFRIVYEQDNWNQDIRDIIFKSDDNIKKKDYQGDITIVLLGVEDKERIDELVLFSNRILSENYDIYVKRTPYYYKRLIHEMMSTGGEVELIYQDNRLIGYVSYMAEGSIYITECLYHPDEKDEVMNIIASHGSAVNQVEKSKEIKNNKNTPTIMSRIINWNSFIKNITSIESLTLIIEVKDDIIVENNGVFHLSFNNQGCIVTKTEEMPEISGDISDLTRLFFGRYNINGGDIICGKDKESIKQKLQKINRYQKIFINDVV